MEDNSYNRMLFEKSVIGLALCKMNGGLVDVNPAYASILGMSVEEVLKLTYWEVTPEKYSEQEQTQLECLEKTGKYGPYEKEYFHADGHLVPVRLSGQIVLKNGEKYILSSVEDITERKKAEAEIKRLNEELERLSLQDGLTGVANRRMFNRILERELKRAFREHSPISLMLIDIDFFKSYNDRYGHLKGDECLKMVANALRMVCKRSIDLLARYGGEEFVLLFPETTHEQAVQLAEQCCSAVNSLNVRHEDSMVNDIVTISVGVSTTIPQKDYQSSELIEAADKLLYKAKNSGRNRVEY